MGVWKIRTKEKDAPAPPELPKVPEDASWHLWESAALEILGKRDFDNSVDYLLQAVDRFDGDSKDMERFFAKISQSIVELADSSASEGRAIPLIKICTIDEEVRVKHPGLMDGVYLYDYIARGIERAMVLCAGPGELTLLSNDLVFLTIGFLWCSCDVREDIDRTAHVAEFCYGQSLRAKGMKKGTVRMLPKEASKALAIHSDYAESIKVALVKATSDMDDTDLDRLAEYRYNNPVDLINELLDALDGANYTAVKGSLTRAKNAAKWQENVDNYALKKISSN